MQIAKQHLIFFKLYEALLDAGVDKQKVEAAIQEIAAKHYIVNWSNPLIAK